jgi:hypothetical protein
MRAGRDPGLGSRTKDTNGRPRRLFVALVAIVIGLVTLGIALIPSPWGRFGWGGWDPTQRADLGSALVTGALIGALLLAAEKLLEDRRSHAAEQDRKDRIAEAARAVNVTLVRYVEALQGAWLQALRVYKNQAVEYGEQLGEDFDAFWAGGLTEVRRDSDELWTVPDVERVLRSALAFVQAVPFGEHARLTDAHLHLHWFLAGLLEGSHERPLKYVAPAPHTESVRLLPWAEEVEEMWVTTQREEVSPDLGAVVELVIADLERAISSLYLASPREVKPLLELRDRVFTDWRRRTRWEQRYRWAIPTLRMAALRFHDELRGMDSVNRVGVRSRLRPSGADANWWDTRKTRGVWLWRLNEVGRVYELESSEAAAEVLLSELPDAEFT